MMGDIAALLCPWACLGSVRELEARALRELGVDGLIVDVDNTLVEWERHEATDELRQWFDRARDAGLRCCIVSNSRRVKRIAVLARELEVAFIAPAGKPLPNAFRRAMRVLGTTASNTAVVGDQVFTDILGGNAIGLRTILVKPVSPREFAGTRLVRGLERLVLRYLVLRGRLPRPGL